MLARDEDILKAAEDWKKAGRGVALATVVETWGSAPRPVGSNLVIDDQGNFLGSVSGGCVEGAVVTEAIDVIESGKPQDAGVRRRRRDRLEGRAVVRRQDPRVRREGGVALAPRYSQSAERRARGAAQRHRRHQPGQRRAAAGKAADIRRRSAQGRAGKASAHRPRAASRRRRKARSSSPCTCRRRSSSSPARCTSARRWRRWGNCSATTSPSSIRARPSPASSGFPT